MRLIPQTPGKEPPGQRVALLDYNGVAPERIGYRGIIFSDDLEMGGILKFMPIEEAAVAAVRAGMELLEICHSPELILRAYEALLCEAERSRAFRARVENKARKLAAARGRFFTAGAGRALTAAEFDALRERMMRFAEKIQQYRARRRHRHERSRHRKSRVHDRGRA